MSRSPPGARLLSPHHPASRGSAVPPSVAAPLPLAHLICRRRGPHWTGRRRTLRARPRRRQRWRTDGSGARLRSPGGARREKLATGADSRMSGCKSPRVLPGVFIGTRAASSRIGSHCHICFGRCSGATETGAPICEQGEISAS